ncbi:MAG: hypothetical protein GAK28_04261 [Luteibacter sp.]|uniref:hypothetical protein n=1 Tax=Luteibacter sp. TaxID=1886636 RepID=UPI001384A0EC|nr:hypothetical protein [Luteibacter sp.]KAF1004097.1 MAG: hypothetical protein GAK28_04261 [Luteibacter sp.]
MKPSPLLDFWQKPDGAGEPVAMLATTFALESEFFERNCLARFLEVSSVDEETGSVDDIVASVELHELLQHAPVTILADRSAPVQRTSLLWDVLSCRVQGGLLHSKVAILLWEKSARVILGSANLTAAGYRRQIELGLAADLGPGCLFPPSVLNAIADELESYLGLVPGYDPGSAVFVRAMRTLEMFRERIGHQERRRPLVRVAFAPTNTTAAPLDALSAAWSGPQPLCATHLSPFWDMSDQNALLSVRKLLTGRPADERRQQVAVVLTRGQSTFSKHLASAVDSVHQLKELDKEIRTLHAKCLLVTSKEWIAALVGSSNHTKAGLGLMPGGRHREMNVWLGAPLDSMEGRALKDLIVLGSDVPLDAEEVAPMDEDETELPVLSSCFGLCRLTRDPDDAYWELRLGITPTHDMPCAWTISLTERGQPMLTREGWEARDKPNTVMVALDDGALPMSVFVQWGDHTVPWAVLSDDRHRLPPAPALSSLGADHLLHALATGRSLAQLVGSVHEVMRAGDFASSGIELNPLKRFDTDRSLLRRGRALAASLNAMQRRLERQVTTIDALRARLASPLGPVFVAVKVVEAAEMGHQTQAEAIFTVAEIALTMSRVPWAQLLHHVDRIEGTALVRECIDRLDGLRVRIKGAPADLAAYAGRAMEEVRSCLSA